MLVLIPAKVSMHCELTKKFALFRRMVLLTEMKELSLANIRAFAPFHRQVLIRSPFRTLIAANMVIIEIVLLTSSRPVLLLMIEEVTKAMLNLAVAMPYCIFVFPMISRPPTSIVLDSLA